MNPSQGIMLGGLFIISIGVINAAVNKRPETPVFAGGVGVLLIASLLEMTGKTGARFASAFIGLAVVTVLIAEGPALFQAIAFKQGNTTKVPPDLTIGTFQYQPHQ